ncbi:MAG: nucleotide exchange factor GrpE [Candidatus Dasytiphilus stammeri]
MNDKINQESPKNENIDETKKEQESPKNENIDETKKEQIRSVDLNQKILMLEKKLEESQKRERDFFLRAQANLENMRRRMLLDIENAHKFALEKFMKELLSVIDNLERALDIGDKNNYSIDSMIKGIELTLRSFLDTIRKFGVEVIKDTNIPFNPDIHQAILIKETKETTSSNYVLKIIQKGYILNGRLLRPAMVEVSQLKS